MKYIEEEARKRVNEQVIRAQTDEYIRQEARKRVNNNQVITYAESILKGKISEHDRTISKLIKEKNELRKQVNRNFGWAFFGWFIVIIIIISLFIANS